MSDSKTDARGVAAWSHANLVNIMFAVSKSHMDLNEQEVFGKIAEVMIKYLTPSSGVQEALEEGYTTDPAILSRDDFLIMKGLWSEYADWIPTWEKQRARLSPTPSDEAITEPDRLIAAIEIARAKTRDTFRDKPGNLVGASGYEAFRQAGGVVDAFASALIEELKKPTKNLDQSTWGNNHRKSYL